MRLNHISGHWELAKVVKLPRQNFQEQVCYYPLEWRLGTFIIPIPSLLRHCPQEKTNTLREKYQQNNVSCKDIEELCGCLADLIPNIPFTTVDDWLKVENCSHLADELLGHTNQECSR